MNMFSRVMIALLLSPAVIAQAPSLGYFVPAQVQLAGQGGVALFGNGFANTTGVTVDGASIAFVVQSNNELSLTMPPHAPGPVVVQVTTLTGVGTNSAPIAAFHYYTPPTPFGVSCSSRTLQSQSPPVLGQVLLVQTVGLGAAAQMMVLGFSNTQWNGTPLPFSLSPFGMPACNLLISMDMEFVLGTQAQFGIAIPNQPALLFLQVYCQALIIDGGFTTTHGLAVLIS